MEPTPPSAFEVLRSSRILAYTVGVVSLLAGIVLLGWPDRTIVVVARLAGILVAVIGIGEVIEALTHRTRGSYWGLLLVRGLLNLLIGVVLLLWPGITVTALVWVFGIDLIATGILGLIVSGRMPTPSARHSVLVRSLVSILFGIVIVAWPAATLWVVTIIVAVQLLIVGLVLLWSGYQRGKLEDQGLTA